MNAEVGNVAQPPDRVRLPEMTVAPSLIWAVPVGTKPPVPARQPIMLTLVPTVGLVGEVVTEGVGLALLIVRLAFALWLAE